MPISTEEMPPPPKSTKAATRGVVTTPKTPRASKPTTPTGKQGSREEAINGVFQVGAFGLVIAGQPADAGALGKYGPGIAHEASKLAESNDGVARVIDYITEAGPYAGLFTAAMPLVLQVLANHKVMKAEMLAGAGVVPPETLAAQVKADMARQQIEAMRAQQEAEQEMDMMRREQAARQSEQSAPNGSAPQSGPNPAMGAQTT